jgi:hypothetical protein
MTAESCCKKESNFLENGEKNNQGERTDLIKIRDEIQEGLTQRELLLKYEVTSSQLKVVDRYYTYLEPKRKSKPNIYWIHGSTGSGKTKYVYDNFKDIYEKDSTKWWDQYDQNETILIDNFRPCQFKFDALLRILDRYPKRLEIKGGFRQLNSKNIIMTTPKDPKTTFGHKYEEDIDQLLRRIDHIIDMDQSQK